MSFQRLHCRHFPSPYLRRGLVAVNEIAVMLILMASLLWLGSQFVASATNDPASPKGKSVCKQ